MTIFSLKCLSKGLDLQRGWQDLKRWSVITNGVIHSFTTVVLNSPLSVNFTWLTPCGSYRATTCREREVILDDIHFSPQKDMEGLPGWVISSMPGPPLRLHEYERRYTPFSHTLILTRRVRKDDYDGQMMFGDLVDLKLPGIYLTGEEKPRNHPGNLSRQGIEPGPAARQARMLPPAP